MLCLQSDHQHAQRRRNLPAASNRSSQTVQTQKVQQTVTKTKCAVCFLCLFDGLRTPSIRRLIRKPRTVCKKPLLTFDPSFYAPSSTEALQELYQTALNCPCSISVDPPVNTALELLKQKSNPDPTRNAHTGHHENASQNQRILIHYFGQGCLEPGSDGCIYFFSDDLTRYKPIKILNMIHTCNCPLCFIFDCPCASIIMPQLATQKDIFAFFACESDECLQLSTDAPMDLFSSCLLSTYDTAIWWHMQRHSTVYDTPRLPNDENKEFLSSFLNSLLDAIAYESQKLSLYQAYTADPAIATLFRGFVLAQRVMLSFNIHCTAFPQLENMDYHPFWDVWDIAIDCCITLSKEDAISMLFNLCVETFDSFGSPGIFAIYGCFITQTPSLSETAAKHLLKYLDSEKGAEMIDSAAASSLPNALLAIGTQTESSLLILAKLLTSSMSTSFNLNLRLTFVSSKDHKLLYAGALHVCCAIIKSYSSTYSDLVRFCFDHILNAAPLSAFLLGLLYERGCKPSSIPGFLSKVGSLLKGSGENLSISTNSNNNSSSNSFLKVTSNPSLSSSNSYFDNDSAPNLNNKLNTNLDMSKKPAPILPNSSSDEDKRASAVFLLGNMSDQNALKLLYGLENDESPLVRQQLLFALLKLTKFFRDSVANDIISKLFKDSHEMITSVVGNVRASVNGSRTQNFKDLCESGNPIFGYFIKSVHDSNFEERYSQNLFLYPGRS